MNNPLTLLKPEDRAQKPFVKPSPKHSSERPSDTLNLLVPWDIPLACQLSEPVKQQLEKSLRSLLQALLTPNLTQAHQQINQTLATFPRPNTKPAQIKSTKTALSTAAVEDYDTYFHISHIQTQTDEDTALCLTQGHLTNCNKFLTLCLNTPNLSLQQITQQKQGFISYTHLLARVFNIKTSLSNEC